MKTRIFLIAILSTLSVVAYADSHTTKRPAKTQPATEPAIAPVVPQTLEQMPAKPPKVTFQGGQMTITADNSTLGDILHAVKAQTGAEVDFPGNASDRVVGQFGPGPARDVLGDLLNGSHFNYVLLGSATNPDALDRVILTAKSANTGESSPPADQTAQITQPMNNAPAPFPAGMQAFRARNGAMIQPPQNSNTVTSEPEDANDDTTSDDDADAQDDQADDSSDDQANGDDAAQQGDQAAGAAEQQNPNGQQNGVKSPEELLQQLQQQQQQTGQPQPGAQPPGMQGGIPPHN